MTWWRDADWAQTAVLSTDPTIPRLALTAVAGRAIGYEPLAKACESPDLVEAYHRCGADADYATDVVAALDAYESMTAALSASGLPTSVAASRAALTFGIPNIDTPYLTLAKNTAVTSDVLLAAADDALARAHGHLLDDEVVKADGTWDENSVQRDADGQFAAQTQTQAYRVVNGRRVAISTSTQRSVSTKKDVAEDVVDQRASDDAILSALDSQKDIMAARHAKRLTRINRINKINTLNAKAKAQAKAKEDARKRKEQADADARRPAAQQVATDNDNDAQTTSTGRPIRSRGLQRVKLRLDAKKQARLDQGRHRPKSLQQQIAEEAMSEHGFTVSSLGGEGPVPEGWTPWPEGGARSAVRAVQELEPESLTEIRTSRGAVLDLNTVTVDGEIHGYPPDLMLEGKTVVSGDSLIQELDSGRATFARDMAKREIGPGMKPPQHIVDDVTREMGAITENDVLHMANLGEQMMEFTDTTHAGDSVFIPFQTVRDAFSDSNTIAGSSVPFSGLATDPFRSNALVSVTGTLQIKRYTPEGEAYEQSYLAVINKADGSWDENEVSRDGDGRFAREPTAASRVVNGRQVQVAVNTARNSDDLAALAQSRREAVARRMSTAARRDRLNRIAPYTRAARANAARAQDTARDTAPATATSAASAKDTSTANTSFVASQGRVIRSRGLQRVSPSKPATASSSTTSTASASAPPAQPPSKSSSRSSSATPSDTRLAQLLSDLATKYAAGRASEDQEWSISSATGPEMVEHADDDFEGEPAVIDEDSWALIEEMMAEPGRVEVHVAGQGTDWDPFVLTVQSEYGAETASTHATQGTVLTSREMFSPQASVSEHYYGDD